MKELITKHHNRVFCKTKRKNTQGSIKLNKMLKEEKLITPTMPKLMMTLNKFNCNHWFNNQGFSKHNLYNHTEKFFKNL